MSPAQFPLPAELYFRVRERALAFARTFHQVANPIILKVSAADESDVQRYGTPGTNDYFNVVIRLENSPAMREMSLAGRHTEDIEETGRFLNLPLDLKVVCTPTDVIHHRWLNMDIC